MNPTTKKGTGLTAKPSKKNPKPSARTTSTTTAPRSATRRSGAADRDTPIDTDTDRIIEVTLQIPFFGKAEQATKMVTNTLPRIVALSIGSNIVVKRSKIVEGKL